MINRTYEVEPTTSILNLEIVLMTISFFIMSTLIFIVPVIPIILHMGIWFAYLLIKSNYSQHLTFALFIIFFVTGWTVLSTFWSNYPSLTIYYSVEYFLLSITSLIIATNLNIKEIIIALIYGMTITLIYSFYIDGKKIISGSYFGYGIYSSKNQIALMAQIALISCFLIIISPIRRFVIGVVMSITIAGIVFYMINNHSATVYLTSMLIIAMASVYYLLIKMDAKIGVMFLMVITFYLLACLFGLMSLGSFTDIYEAILNFFGKDTTLTGRTYLWTVGIEQGMQAPYLGLGYSSFWVPGNPPAEELWRLNKLEETKSGFHFHNLFIGWFVELGFIGVTLLVLSLLAVMIKLMLNSIEKNRALENLFIFMFFFVILMRSFSEMDIIGPFGIMPLIYFILIGLLFKKGESNKLDKTINNKNFIEHQFTSKTID